MFLLNKKEKKTNNDNLKDSKKINDKERLKLKTNNEIKSNKVRLISETDSSSEVVFLKEAIYKAELLGMDLVEVSSNSNPPVCKIVDIGKYKYEIKRKAAENKKKQTCIELKEIKLRPKIDIHDFNVKLKKIKDFLFKGNKCKVTIIFKGREIIHTDIGKKILDKILENLENDYILESPPKLEGKQMQMLLCFKKK
mgnify:CR=1 FL=1